MRRTIAVSVPIGRLYLQGDMRLPAGPHGLVLFAHGSGSSRHSPRNQYVGGVLEQHGFATLLIDLLTDEEEAVDRRTAHLRFDIEMLAERLTTIIDWLHGHPDTASLPIGLFGASTGGGAALVAAAARPEAVGAVVSRGGRPDLAESALPHVTAPTLLIVGGFDTPVIQLNRAAMAQMPGVVRLELVPGATHLFEEPGALEQVATLAARWFARHLEPAYETGLHGASPPSPPSSVNRRSEEIAMKTVNIPRRDWTTQLDEFSRMHEGWLVSLDILAESIGAQPEFRQMPLVGVTAEHGDGGTITIAVAEATGDQLTHTIHSPTHVFLEETDAGAHVALEIESADGTKAILRFRATALPETVDGIIHSR